MKAVLGILMFVLGGLYFATQYGPAIYVDAVGGPWIPAPELRLDLPKTPPCERVNFVVSFCRFTFTDASGKHDLPYAVFGRFLVEGDDIGLARSERWPGVVTMRHAVDALPNRVCMFLFCLGVIWALPALVLWRVFAGRRATGETVLPDSLFVPAQTAAPAPRESARPAAPQTGFQERPTFGRRRA